MPAKKKQDAETAVNEEVEVVEVGEAQAEEVLENAEENEEDQEEEQEAEVQVNEDGFVVGETLKPEDVLAYMAKQRQKNKAVQKASKALDAEAKKEALKAKLLAEADK